MIANEFGPIWDAQMRPARSPVGSPAGGRARSQVGVLAPDTRAQAWWSARNQFVKLKTSWLCANLQANWCARVTPASGRSAARAGGR